MLHVFSILPEPLTLMLIAFAVEYKSPCFLFISFRVCAHKITRPPAMTAPDPKNYIHFRVPEWFQGASKPVRNLLSQLHQIALNKLSRVNLLNILSRPIASLSFSTPTSLQQSKHRSLHSCRFNFFHHWRNQKPGSFPSQNGYGALQLD